MAGGRLPNFLSIGVPRAGTSWLSEALQAHPEAFVPPGKEISFFIQDDFRSTWHKGLDWYRSLFDITDDGRIKAWGELSPRYYFMDETPRLIQQVVPRVRIIYLLRHPVEMLYSLAAYHLAMYPEAIDGSRYGFFDYVDHHLVGPLGFFARHYNRYAACFAREQIFVGFYDDLKRDPAELFAGVCRFLGIDDRVVPPAVHQRVNPAVVPKRFWLSVLAAGLSRRVWSGFARLDERLNRIEYNRWPGRVHSLVSPDIFARLMHLYRSDVHELERLLDRDLSHWFDYAALDPAIRFEADEKPEGGA